MNALLTRLLVSVVCGVLLGFSFPPYDFWFLAPLAVALFTLTTFGQGAWRALGFGFITGLTWFLVLMDWVTVVGNDAWIGVGIFAGFWIALTAWGTAIVTRVAGWPFWVMLIWITQEAIRSRVPLGGFTWGSLGFSQSDGWLLPAANLAGVPALTGLVALVGAVLAWLVRSALLQEWPAVCAAAAIAVVALVLPLLIPLSSAGQDDAGPQTATIAVVQGDVPHIGVGFSTAAAQTVLNNHVSQTERLAADIAAGRVSQPDAVLWPENASDVDPFTEPGAEQRIEQAAAAVGVPILLGAIVREPTTARDIWNMGVVWDPVTGPGDNYKKQHPVPFGEYVPMRERLGDFTDRFIDRDVLAGTEPGVLDVGPVRVGDVICFEVAYGDLVRDSVLGGGRLLAVQTNNATFTGYGQTEQQLAMSRVRAVEHGRTAVVTSTNGISAIITPDGEVLEQLGESTAGYMIQSVPLRDELSWSARLAWAPELLAAVGALAAIGVGLSRAPRPLLQPARRARTADKD